MDASPLHGAAVDAAGFLDVGMLQQSTAAVAAQPPPPSDDEFEDLSCFPGGASSAIRPLLPAIFGWFDAGRQDAAAGVIEELALLAELLYGLEDEGGNVDAAAPSPLGGATEDHARLAAGSQPLPHAPVDGVWSPNPADAAAAVRLAQEAAGGRSASPDGEGLREGVEAALAAVVAKMSRQPRATQSDLQ